MPTDTYIHWLRERSMLEQAKHSSVKYSGQAAQWQRPFSATQPAAAAQRASVWFTAYPSSLATIGTDSVLQTLANPALWKLFQSIGIEAMHTGPLKQAGSISGTSYAPTIDGHFDRISTDIDAQFGTIDDYKTMVANAQAHGATIIGDIVPSHSGKGADWRLAECAVDDYSGLYHMVEIDQADWSLLPPVADGHDSVNLGPETVDVLAARGYIVGQLSRVIFYETGVKESNWSATDVVEGADGVARRWVYLHYFKEGQPSFNWLDQSFAAQRLVVGDILHSLGELGVGMVRLDANGFLGIERMADGTVVSEGHPLAVLGNQLLGGTIRKAGGFSFQELNLTLEDLASLASGGADLSYDFVTRPAYHHALVSGDAEFLRLMLTEMGRYDIRPNSLVHALQNHDELTLELVHFWTRHAESPFTYNGQTRTGTELRDEVRATMFGRLLSKQAYYNLQSTTNGVACTSASIAMAILGIENPDALSAEQVAQIKQLHLLLVVFNAFQPGVFAISGWDLVGAATLPIEEVAELAADGDTRWINRGGYDLLGNGGSAALPMARALYGSLPEQLEDPTSFVAQLQKLLSIRKQHRIFESEQLGIAGSGSLLVMIHALPDDAGMQLTAINFGAEPVKQTVALPAALSGRVVDLLSDTTVTQLQQASSLTLQLDGYSSQLLAVFG